MPEINVTTPRPTGGVAERHAEAIEVLLSRYPTARSILLPLLWIVQEEDGWISPEVMEEVAAVCESTAAEVFEVVSFYQMYNRQPVGKYVVGICGTLPCALCAADGMYEYLSDKLGIAWGETTTDGLFTIQRRECLGACSEAPVMLVNQELETKLTREKIDRILDQCRSEKRQPYFTGRRNGNSEGRSGQ